MQHKNLIISIPKEIKNKIDAEFGKEYSKAGLEKIYFIYFKINKEGNNYQVNSTNHTWMLGYKNRGELGQILKRLKDKLSIIELTNEYSIGYKSNSYSVIKPYDYKNENCYIIRFYDGQVKFPNWVQKYIADGGNAKNSETTNWVKIPTKSVNNETEKDIEIKRLQALLQANGIDYSAHEVNSLGSVKKPVTTSSEVIFQPVVNNKFSKNSIDESNVVTLDHEAQLHDLTPDVKEFEYAHEKFIVRNWNKILENKNSVATDEEIFEEISDCNTNRAEKIYYGNVMITKRYDYNEKINYVEVA